MKETHGKGTTGNATTVASGTREGTTSVVPPLPRKVRRL